MNTKMFRNTVGLCLLILLVSCTGGKTEGEENLPSVCIDYKHKAQELLQPFPDMLYDVEQTTLDINQQLENASDEQRLFITETCTSLLADLEEIEGSSNSSIISMY